MPKRREPTTGENAVSRLFLRFFLCYLLAAPVALMIALRGVWVPTVSEAGAPLFFFVPLALLGALLTVTKPYLLVLTVLKAFYDVGLLYSITLWTRQGYGGLLPWNASFLLIVFSLLLFCIAAACAELFSFLHPARDARLLFSRPFGRYLIESLLFAAIALSAYFLWPQICNLLEITSATL